MDNKIDKLKASLESPQFYSTHFHQAALPFIEPIERIFPTPSYLFESKESRNLSEPRINFASLSHFKPKF